MAQYFSPAVNRAGSTYESILHNIHGNKLVKDGYCRVAPLWPVSAPWYRNPMRWRCSVLRSGFTAHTLDALAQRYGHLDGSGSNTEYNYEHPTAIRWGKAKFLV